MMSPRSDISFSAAPGGASSLQAELAGVIVTADLASDGKGGFTISHGILVGRWPTGRFLTALATVQDPLGTDFLCGDSGVYASVKGMVCGYALLVLFCTDLTEFILPDALQFPLMILLQVPSPQKHPEHRDAPGYGGLRIGSAPIFILHLPNARPFFKDPVLRTRRGKPLHGGARFRFLRRRIRGVFFLRIGGCALLLGRGGRDGQDDGEHEEKGTIEHGASRKFDFAFP